MVGRTRRGKDAHEKRHGVVEVVDENKSCDSGMKPLTLKWVDNMNSNVRRSQLVSGAIKKFEKRDDQLGPEGTRKS